jgi:hypothetical protein
MSEQPPDYVGEALANATWKKGSFSAKELQSMKFPPISWIVPDIIPAEGVTLLCSKPKFGKSWLVYDLCIACTTDRFTLGTIKPAQGDVLYLALEDSKRRLQRRMDKLLPTFGATWPERLTLKTEWRRLHEGGLDDIRAWHTHTKLKGGRPILVGIDVLAKARKPVGNRQVYEADYAALAGLTALANELGLAMVVVHHTRKNPADDLMETVSGSYGLSGAADTILVMAAKGSGTVLDIRGRDVEPAELAIEFDKTTYRWRVLGKAVEVHVSEQRAKIMAALAEAGEPLQIAALIEATGMKRNPLDVLLGRMRKDGEIQRVGTGLYAHKDYVPLPSQPSGKGKRGRQSVVSVSVSTMPTDRGTDPRCVEQVENNQQNTGVCRSVASVRANADTKGVRASVPAQTDATDGQIERQGAVLNEQIETTNLSGDLSDNLSDVPDPSKLSNLSDLSASDDYPEMPACLRRPPSPEQARNNGHAPALGPQGDSVDDFQ